MKWIWVGVEIAEVWGRPLGKMLWHIAVGVSVSVSWLVAIYGVGVATTIGVAVAVAVEVAVAVGVGVGVETHGRASLQGRTTQPRTPQHPYISFYPI